MAARDGYRRRGDRAHDPHIRRIPHLPRPNPPILLRPRHRTDRITDARRHPALWVIPVGLAICLLGAGCGLGPKSLHETRQPYNEAVKLTSEEQLLLNIVRLRYSDNPSSLAVPSIAAQF